MKIAFKAPFSNMFHSSYNDIKYTPYLRKSLPKDFYQGFITNMCNSTTNKKLTTSNKSRTRNKESHLSCSMTNRNNMSPKQRRLPNASYTERSVFNHSTDDKHITKFNRKINIHEGHQSKILKSFIQIGEEIDSLNNSNKKRATSKCGSFQREVPFTSRNEYSILKAKKKSRMNNQTEKRIIEEKKELNYSQEINFDIPSEIKRKSIRSPEEIHFKLVRYIHHSQKIMKYIDSV